MTELTATDWQMVLAIAIITELTGLPPSRRELQDWFGYRSSNAITERLESLRGKGVLTWVRGKGRTLTLTKPLAFVAGEGDQDVDSND